MKISEEEKQKQIEQMWADYEKTNKPSKYTQQSTHADYLIDESEDVYEYPSYSEQKNENRKNKKPKKSDKKKFTKHADNDSD